MKTIKGTTSPTSKILNFIAYPVLILIAVCGFFMEAQSMDNFGDLNFGDIQTKSNASQLCVDSEICGQANPRNVFALHPEHFECQYLLNDDADHFTKQHLQNLLQGDSEIGGQANPRQVFLDIESELKCIKLLDDNLHSTRQADEVFAYEWEIGGNQASPRPFFGVKDGNVNDIGGGQIAPRNP